MKTADEIMLALREVIGMVEDYPVTDPEAQAAWSALEMANDRLLEMAQRQRVSLDMSNALASALSPPDDAFIAALEGGEA